MGKEATVMDRTKCPIHCLGLLNANQNKIDQITFYNKLRRWGEIFYLCFYYDVHTVFSVYFMLVLRGGCRKYFRWVAEFGVAPALARAIA